MKKVLFGGFFDIIHSGHLMSIDDAQKYGDWLIINVSPDKRAREKKGPGRPFMSIKERMFNVSHIKGVDEVVSIDAEDNMTPTEYIKKTILETKPDVLICSVDSDEIGEYCRLNGVKLVRVPEIIGIDGLHSTDIINKINS